VKRRLSRLVSMVIPMVTLLVFAAPSFAQISAPVIESPTDNSYNNTGEITFSGTAEPQSTVRLFEGKTALGRTTADSDGKWTHTISGVAEGSHIYTARALDATKNASSLSAPVTVIVDTTAPETTIDSSPSPATKSTTATFAFSSETDATFECKLDNEAFEDCTSPKDYTSLSDGEHTFEVRATDTAGNTDPTPATHTWTVDATPTITAPADNSYNNSGEITFSGMAGPGSTVRLFDEGTGVGRTTADSEGNWTKTLTGIAEGSHTYTARAVDTAGNRSSLSSPVRVTMDKTAPSAPTVALHPASDMGSSDTDGITNDSTPTFIGTAEAASKIEIFDNEESLGESTADDSGNWSFTPTKVLNGNQHAVKAKATDAAGNTSTAFTTLRLTIDTVKPEAPTISSPKDGSYSLTGDFTISGTAEADSSVNVTENSKAMAGSPITASDGSWKVDLKGVSEGEHTYTATAKDIAGNASSESSITVKVDTKKPDAPTISNPKDDTTTNSSTISGNGEAGSTIALSDNETELPDTAKVDANGDWSLKPALRDGSHSVKAKATDAAGNESGATNTVSFTLDTTKPDAPRITSPRNGASTTSTIIKGTAEANSTVSIYDNTSTRLGTTPTDDGGQWSFGDLKDGDHSITATATDGAGNTSIPSSTVKVTIDTKAPSIPVITSPDKKGYDNEGNFTISGTAEPNVAVELQEEITSRGTAKVDDSGNWSVRVRGVGEGKHTYTARVTDAVGHTSKTSAPVVVIVDKIAPTITRVGPDNESTGQRIGRNVVARFSEGMNADTLAAGNVKLINTQTGSEVKAKVLCEDSCRTLRLDPNTRLKRNTKYRVIITSDVEDLAGNRLARNKVWSFTTVA
jgi:large repetitive protein